MLKNETNENIGSVCECDIMRNNPSRMKVKMPDSDLITIDRNLFYDLENNSRNELHDSGGDISKDHSLETLQSLSIMDAQNIEYLPPDVQNCVEINTSNVIDIPENQILQIQYHTETGVVNTEYIVNDDILQMQFEPENTSFIEVSQANMFAGSEALFEEHSDSTSQTISDASIEIDSNFRESFVNNMNTIMLSPKSDVEETQETDLTSLNWLHNITNIMAVPNLPTPPVSPKPKRKNNSSQEDLTVNINYYKRNGDKKPPFSYATLICMAMGKNGNKMTLSAIYHWIRENFLYYRKAHPSWQNSIRHNLSLNKCFMKIARSKDEPGKGGFWKLDLERLEESRRSKRRSSLTVRAPRNRQENTTKPVKKTKRYRPYQSTGERKHNILSNISICGETDIENTEDCGVIKKSNKKSSKGDEIKGFVPSSMPNEGVITEPVNQPLNEDLLNGLLLNNTGWEDCQLEMLDSLLDSL